MKSTGARLLIICVVLICSALISCNIQADSKKPATAEELSQMNRDFAKALNNMDAAAATNCYTEDVTCFRQTNRSCNNFSLRKQMFDNSILRKQIMINTLNIRPVYLK
jgi:hypothetical protein